MMRKVSIAQHKVCVTNKQCSDNTCFTVLVDDFKRDFLHSRLSHICKDVGFAGGSYELTGIPGSSDYDLPLYYKLSGRATVGPVVDSEWVQVQYDGRRLSTEQVILLSVGC
jgi:hypothetical protein